MRAGRGALAAAAVAGLVGAGAGCDWRSFDQLQGQTPVLSVAAPPSYAAPNDFGSVLLALEPPADGTAAARYLASGTNQPAVGLITIDAGGHPTGINITGAAFDDLNGYPVTSMAEVPGANKALLGGPMPTGGDLFLLDLAPPYGVVSFVTSSDPQLGVGVAAGALGGGPAPDLVAVSGKSLHVYVDGKTTAPDTYYTDSGAADPCPLFLSASLPERIRNHRPVIIAPLLGGTGVQIAVGTPVTTGSGTVSIFNVDTASGVATCALALRGTSGADQRFGQALAVGDFDGDGTTDLLVGEPPSTVYLFRGPVGATPTATITNATGVDFGAALAALPLDAHSGDEALIADPEATVNGATVAGTVTIRSGPMLGATLMPTPAVSQLTSTGAHSEDAFGSALAALPFCGSKAATSDAGVTGGGGVDGGAATDAGAAAFAACVRTRLPLVGAVSHVYTYFTLGPVDPRAR